MKRVPRRRFLASATVAGIVALAGCQSGLGRTDETDESRVPYSVTGPPESDAGEPGWILLERGDGAFSATFEMRVCGEVDDVEVLEMDDDEYRLDVTANLGTDEDDCRTERLLGSFDAPTDRLSLRVSVNDVPIESIERSGTTTSLHRLPELLTEETISE